jgi:hypothetical protein
MSNQWLGHGVAVNLTMTDKLYHTTSEPVGPVKRPRTQQSDGQHKGVSGVHPCEPRGRNEVQGGVGNGHVSRGRYSCLCSGKCSEKCSGKCSGKCSATRKCKAGASGEGGQGS